MMNLIRAEWIKFASLRSSWIRLVMAFVLNGLFVGFSLWLFNRQIGDTVPDTSVASRVGVLTAGVSMGSLVFIVVGINIFSAEIRSRSIMPTAAAAPDRGNLVAAKAGFTALAGALAAAVVMLVTAIVTFIVLDVRGFPIHVDDEDVVRSIFGSIAYMAIAGLFGLGIALIVNSSTAAIAIGLLWPLALESALKGFLPDWFAKILPFEAGTALIEAGVDHEMPAWEGGGVFLAWSAVLIFLGFALFNRRDLSDS